MGVLKVLFEVVVFHTSVVAHVDDDELGFPGNVPVGFMGVINVLLEVVVFQT